MINHFETVHDKFYGFGWSLKTYNAIGCKVIVTEEDNITDHK